MGEIWEATGTKRFTNGVAGARYQRMIFGMFGVAADLQGRITVNPVPPSFSPRIRLTGLKIRGRSIDIEAGDGEFTVTTGGRSMKSNVGRPVVLEPEEQPLHRS